MDISHIEHIGIAVENLDEAMPTMKTFFGLKCYAIEEVADQKVKQHSLKLVTLKLNFSNQHHLMDRLEIH